MSGHGHATASDIRARLTHPIIDADGHWLEFGPFVNEQLRRIGGDQAVEGFQRFPNLVRQHLNMSVAERRDKRIAQQSFWAIPTKNSRDLATSMMPRLLYERLDELGIDFSVLYPTVGLGIHRLPDAEMRQATCRAYNIFTASYFHDYSNRMTPAAVIPMHTPDEAIAEMEYVTRELGLKVIMMGSLIRRPIPALADQPTEVAAHTTWLDSLGLDSEYDYDPVWAKCDELGLSPSFHTGGRGFGLRLSPSNFVYNHIGHFAAANEAVCKALFLGGGHAAFSQRQLRFSRRWRGMGLSTLGRSYRALGNPQPGGIGGGESCQSGYEYDGRTGARIRQRRNGRGDAQAPER